MCYLFSDVVAVEGSRMVESAAVEESGEDDSMDEEEEEELEEDNTENILPQVPVQ
jgi:hypothetical protein